jgi:hypothetical protein
VRKGKTDVNADVLERREAGVEGEVKMGTGKGGMKEDTEGEIPKEEKHRPRM